MGQEQQDMQEEQRRTTSYQAIVAHIVDGWAIGKPVLQSTGKPSGYYRLTKYLLDYLLANAAFPKGIHLMPEGRDRYNNLEPSFPVDFDSIIGDSTLPD